MRATMYSLFCQSGSKIKNTRALLGYFDLRNAKGRTTGTAVPYLYTAYIHLISVTVGEKSRKVTDLEKSAVEGKVGVLIHPAGHHPPTGRNSHKSLKIRGTLSLTHRQKFPRILLYKSAPAQSYNVDLIVGLPKIATRILL